MAARRIDVFDTTLRDGEQVPGASLNREEKVKVAHQLALLGVDVIEAGFAASSPGDFAAVKTIAEEVRGPVITALARAVESDIEAVAEAVKPAERSRIHIVLGTSDTHLEHKFRKSRDQVMEMGVKAVKFAKKLCPEIEYSTEDASRSDFDYLCRTVEAVIDAGATVVNIPDTVGYAVPEQWGDLIRRIIEHVPNIHKVKVSVHCHNDLGMATANSLAAIKAGAQQVECTINGLGERAGNAALEEIVMALKMRTNFYGANTGIDTHQIFPTSMLVRELMHMPVQPNKAIVGANAFAHSSGIHQDGFLKNRENYEIMRPGDVGIANSDIVLTARSGRHALRHRLERLGYVYSDDQKETFEKIHIRFLTVADRQKEVVDEDLHILVSDAPIDVPQQYILEDYHATSTHRGEADATVRIQISGESIEAIGHGISPVEAAFNAIDNITKLPTTLDDVQTSSNGIESANEVKVRVCYHEHTFNGIGSDTDVIKASIEAYLSSLNQLVAIHSGLVKE
jgi:2-isopropylmalate synthase